MHPVQGNYQALRPSYQKLSSSVPVSFWNSSKPCGRPLSSSSSSSPYHVLFKLRQVRLLYQNALTSVGKSKDRMVDYHDGRQTPVVATAVAGL
jgi:hypothetical protein